jgi:transposase
MWHPRRSPSLRAVAARCHNSVLDSASIQVSRRRRRLKTDRTDAESLLRVFMAWHRGERQACSVVRVPSPEDEDMKRLHRSRANLLRERVRHVNRIRGLLHFARCGSRPPASGGLGCCAAGFANA